MARTKDGTLRIVGGQHGGRILRAVPGNATRPTRAAVREAIFNMLGERVRDADVLDLFAGSGAMGLEAYSRGARSVSLVENSREALRVLRSNVQTLGAESSCHILPVSAWALETATPQRFDLIFADPPYDYWTRPDASDKLHALLHVLLSKTLNPEGAILLEASRGSFPDFSTWPDCAPLKSKRWGRTEVALLGHVRKDDNLTH